MATLIPELDRAARLAPVDLDTVAQEAALLTRIDRKYIVRPDDAGWLLDRLPASAQVLQIDGLRAFGYRSTYFDTAELDSYRRAAVGRRRRWKVRTRTYVDTGATYLEVKTRAAVATVKDRRPADDADHLGPDDLAWVRDVLADRGIDDLPTRLRPVLQSRYDRTTVVLPDDGARLTLDTDLRWNDATRTLRPRPVVVVETKSPGAAGDVDRLLWRHGHRPARISKYGTAMAALHPEQPHHRWTRTLREHF